MNAFMVRKEDDVKMVLTWSANLVRYLLTIRITDILDMLIMAFIIYKLLTLVKTSRVANLLKGVFIFLAALWLSTILNFHGLSYIMSRMVEWGVLALIILFQPEIRRVLEQVGSRKLNFFSLFVHGEALTAMEHTIGQTVVACTEMSKSRTGALIVFEREILLDDMVRSGTVLNATVSSELLKNIFFVKAPMHDGAVIIRKGKLLGAGCMLPLSKNVNLSRDLGMRHRAGIGMSENSDAVVVIVSEETGSISVAIGGMLKRHLMPETLENLLRNELLPQDNAEPDQRRRSLLERLRPGKGGGGNNGK
jgi:diadenylate cyclase